MKWLLHNCIKSTTLTLSDITVQMSIVIIGTMFSGIIEDVVKDPNPLTEKLLGAPAHRFYVIYTYSQDIVYSVTIDYA